MQRIACSVLWWSMAASLAAQSDTGGVPSPLAHPRIAPLDEKDWSAHQRELLAPEGPTVLNLYRILIRYPELHATRRAFGKYLQRESSLPPREREILILRAAWLSSAEYEWGEHRRIGLANGLIARDFDAIAKGADGWGEFDAALIRAADELHRDFFVSDATWNALARRYNTQQLMEAVMTVGHYHMLAMAINSIGVPMEKGAEGFPKRAGAERARPVGRGGVPMRLSRPRIEPVKEGSWSEEQRALLASLRADRGYLPNVYGTIARDTKLYPLWLAFARHILRESSLPAREREMLICRTAWLANGEYEWAAHTKIGTENGLTDAEIARLARGAAAGWSTADAMLLKAVDELHYDAFLDDATWGALAGRFDTRQMMDLVFTVGAYNLLAMALNSFGAQLDSGMVGFLK
jgi:4-carboxymuconolactone decarboxylase